MDVSVRSGFDSGLFVISSVIQILIVFSKDVDFPLCKFLSMYVVSWCCFSIQNLLELFLCRCSSLHRTGVVFSTKQV